ncbi:MAG: hypothetical protein AAF645_10580, partial [Myxococcota bacterium]
MKKAYWILLALTVSCSGTERSLDEDLAYEERIAERARRMALTYVSGGTETEITADALITALRSYAECSPEQSEAWTSLEESSIDSMCRIGLRTEVFEYDCAATLALELATTEGPVELLRTAASPMGPPVDEVHVFAPRNPEARIALAQAAIASAQTAMTAAGDTIRRIAGQTPDFDPLGARVTDCDPYLANLRLTTLSATDADGALTFRSAAGLLADALAGAVVTIEAAAQVEVQYQSAVAEAERSRSSSPATASELGWTDGLMSRASAAKSLIGGSVAGLYGFDQGEGVCPVPTPDASTQAAAEFLRATGGSPRDIMNTDLSLSDLFFDGSGVTGETLSTTLGTLLGEAPPTAMDDVLELANVSESDFTRARRYMREEARAFATPVLETARGIPLSGADPLDSTAPRVQTAWATTLRPAVAPHAAYYVAAAAYADLNDVTDDRVPITTASPGTLQASTAAFAGRSVVHALDYAFGIATDIGSLDAPFSGGFSFTPLPDDARTALAPLIETAADRLPARVVYCQRATGASPHHRVDVLHRGLDFVSPATLAVVRGSSGLRCAVDGSVMGERCDLSDYSVTPISVTASSGTTWREAGFTRVVRMEFGTLTVGSAIPGELPQEAAERDLVFIVRQVGDVAEPGNYEPIGTHRLGKSGDYCTRLPYAPEYVEMVGELLAPSPTNCTTTSATCAGPSFADRIPLEN